MSTSAKRGRPTAPAYMTVAEVVTLWGVTDRQVRRYREALGGYYLPSAVPGLPGPLVFPRAAVLAFERPKRGGYRR